MSAFGSVGSDHVSVKKQKPERRQFSGILARVEGKRHFEAADLLALSAQDALHAVVPVGQPVGQIHVRQVEVRLRQRVGALWRRWTRGILGNLDRRAQ